MDYRHIFYRFFSFSLVGRDRIVAVAKIDDFEKCWGVMTAGGKM